MLDRLNEAIGASHKAEIVVFAGSSGDYTWLGPPTVVEEVFMELHIIELGNGIR